MAEDSVGDQPDSHRVRFRSHTEECDTETLPNNSISIPIPSESPSKSSLSKNPSSKSSLSSKSSFSSLNKHQGDNSSSHIHQGHKHPVQKQSGSKRRFKRPVPKSKPSDDECMITTPRKRRKLYNYVKPLRKVFDCSCIDAGMVVNGCICILICMVIASALSSIVTYRCFQDVGDLKAQNENLTIQLTELIAENELLKSKLAQVRSLKPQLPRYNSSQG